MVDLADIRAAAARIESIAIKTPLISSPALDEAVGGRILLKAENLQRTGSFKIRGAYNMLSQLSPQQAQHGAVAFSSGNHAQGIARAARLLGMPALIVMPSDAPAVKVAGVRADGGDIHFYDRNSESREEIAARLTEERGAVLVPSYDDPHIITGQGTAGLEFVRQAETMGGPLDFLICCAGGGGLITGCALAIEALSPRTSVWTAEPDGHDDWKRSLEAGEIVANAPGTRSICDAILTPEPGVMPFAIGKRLLAGGVTVSDDYVREAMRTAFRYLKIVAEPGGSAALAAVVRGVPDAMRGKRVGVLVTGGNVDAGTYAEILQG